MDLSQWHIARSISQDEFEMLKRVNTHFEKIKELKEKRKNIRVNMATTALLLCIMSIGLFFPFEYTYRGLSADARIDIGGIIVLSFLTTCLSATLLAFLGGWLIGWLRHHKEIGTETEQIFQIYSETPVGFLAALDLIETLESGTVRLADWFVQRMFKNYKAGKERGIILRSAS